MWVYVGSNFRVGRCVFAREGGVIEGCCCRGSGSKFEVYLDEEDILVFFRRLLVENMLY